MNNDVKQRILSESMLLMFNHGIKVMTMDELAKRIGVSKRTIYEHFEDKDTLLTAVLRESKKQNKKQAEKSLKEKPNVIHVFHQYMTNYENNYFSKLASVVDEIKRYHPAVYQKEIVAEFGNKLIELKKIFQLGIDQGVFRKDLNIDIAASLFQSTGQWIFKGEIDLREQFSLEKIFETYLLIFIRGCCTEKGLKVMDELTKK